MPVPPKQFSLRKLRTAFSAGTFLSSSHATTHGAVRMIAIDDAYVDSVAPNTDAGKNGRGLVLKNKLGNLHVSDDGSLLFGECQGSGSKPYQCSCDFARPEQPTYRCTCPSRQFPCKHCLGLMYAYAQKKPFKPSAVPEELQAKREKLADRTEK